MFVGQAFTEGRHIRFVSRWIRSGAILDYLEEKVIFVVPCMSGSVVWWRGHSPIRPTLVPIWLAFECHAVTTRALPRINTPPRLYSRE